MLSPSYLHKGDKIAIVATARKVSREELQPAVEILQQWGLEPVFGKNLFNSCNQFSGTDAERAEDLQWALDDPSVKAVIIARGGYGTVRVVDRIDFSKFVAQPKWVIGYSDVTILHGHINRNFGIEALHATMAFSFSKHAEATESIRKAIFGEELTYTIPADPHNRNGSCEAELVGGNLSLIYALAGSKSDIDTRGKILFIEDLDEYLYHIDRMVISLKRSGKLEGLKGLVVGGMSEMKDNAIPFGKTTEEIILEAVAAYSFPVSFGFPAGHIDRNLALYMGRKARLTVDSKNTSLKFL